MEKGRECAERDGMDGSQANTLSEGSELPPSCLCNPTSSPSSGLCVPIE